MIRNLNMGSHRVSRSSETSARTFSPATSQPPYKRSHLCPKVKSADLVTDQEITFADLVLSGTMTDRQAAGRPPVSTPTPATYTKAKPRVRAYMLEHRAAIHDHLLLQESKQQRRLNLGRERVLARLWEIADLDPDMTRNSMSAPVKDISMIVAIEGLIPDRNTNRRAGSAQNKSTPPPVNPQIDTAACLRERQGKTTGPQPGPDPAPDREIYLAFPIPRPARRQARLRTLALPQTQTFVLSGSIFARSSSPSEARLAGASSFRVRFCSRQPGPFLYGKETRYLAPEALPNHALPML